MKPKIPIIWIAVLSLGILITQAFAYSGEELFYGSSNFEIMPSSVIPGKPTEFEIKFRYTTGPYGLSNFSPVIEISPDSASSKVRVDVEPIEGISRGQVVRIPVTITVDPSIDHEKIFLSVYFTGEHFSSSSDLFYKSAWIDSVTLDIESLPIPEPTPVCGEEMILKNGACVNAIGPVCGPGTTYQDGICIVDKTENESTETTEKWGDSTSDKELDPDLTPIRDYDYGLIYVAILLIVGIIGGVVGGIIFVISRKRK